MQQKSGPNLLQINRIMQQLCIILFQCNNRLLPATWQAVVSEIWLIEYTIGTDFDLFGSCRTKSELIAPHRNPMAVCEDLYRSGCPSIPHLLQNSRPVDGLISGSIFAGLWFSRLSPCPSEESLPHLAEFVVVLEACRSPKSMKGPHKSYEDQFSNSPLDKACSFEAGQVLLPIPELRNAIQGAHMPRKCTEAASGAARVAGLVFWTDRREWLAHVQVKL